MKKVINRKRIMCNMGVARTREDLTTLTTARKRGALDYLTRHAEVSEKSIEKYLAEQAKERGLLCLKYSNPGRVGYPDRLLVLPGATVIWVELKSKGRKPDVRQRIRHAELSGLGHVVRVIDNKADIDELLDSIVI